MIDIWLVLCQMVPFAEVVLQTAMEYHRKDDSNGRDRDMLMKMDDETEDEAEDKWCQNCWVPQLATIGNIFFRWVIH